MCCCLVNPTGEIDSISFFFRNVKFLEKYNENKTVKVIPIQPQNKRRFSRTFRNSHTVGIAFLQGDFEIGGWHFDGTAQVSVNLVIRTRYKIKKIGVKVVYLQCNYFSIVAILIVHSIRSGILSNYSIFETQTITVLHKIACFCCSVASKF